MLGAYVHCMELTVYITARYFVLPLPSLLYLCKTVAVSLCREEHKCVSLTVVDSFQDIFKRSI